METDIGGWYELIDLALGEIECSRMIGVGITQEVTSLDELTMHQPSDLHFHIDTAIPRDSAWQEAHPTAHCAP